jgi:hypothetical protein
MYSTQRQTGGTLPPPLLAAPRSERWEPAEDALMGVRFSRRLRFLQLLHECVVAPLKHSYE